MSDVLRPFTPQRRPRNYYKRGSTMTPRQVEEDREKYTFRLRPTSAPTSDTLQRSNAMTSPRIFLWTSRESKRNRIETKSALGRIRHGDSNLDETIQETCENGNQAKCENNNENEYV